MTRNWGCGSKVEHLLGVCAKLWVQILVLKVCVYVCVCMCVNPLLTSAGCVW